MGQHQRSAGEPRHPAQPKCLRTLGGFLDIEHALQIAAQQRGDTGPEPGRGGQRGGGVTAVGCGIQVTARLVHLPGQEADHADGQLAGRLRQLAGELFRGQRIMSHRLVQQTGPVIPWHRGRLQPAGQRLALGRADEPGLARSEDPLGPMVGIDCLPPAPFGTMTTGAAEHQPGILAK